MTFIDTHLHLDTKEQNISNAFKKIIFDMKKSNISKAFLIHMNDSKWNEREFIQFCDRNYKDIFYKFLLIDPMKFDFINKKNINYLFSKINGIKLHPRIGNYSLKGSKVLKLCKIAEKFNLKIIIDTFPDGDSIINNFNVNEFSYLAKKFPKVKFLWAHMGGYKLIEFTMAKKRLPNVYLDFSYSLLYFRKSSLLKDFYFAFHTLNFSNIMYGSDYPDRSIKETIKMTNQILKEFKLTKSQKNKLIFKNAINFIN